MPGWFRLGYPSPKMACMLSKVPNSNVLQIKHNTVTSVCLIALRGFFFFPSQAGLAAFCFEEPGKCVHLDLPSLCLD